MPWRLGGELGVPLSPGNNSPPGWCQKRPSGGLGLSPLPGSNGATTHHVSGHNTESSKEAFLPFSTREIYQWRPRWELPPAVMCSREKLGLPPHLSVMRPPAWSFFTDMVPEET